MRLDWARLRQKTFPAEFRIDTGDGDDFATALAAAYTAALMAARNQKADALGNINRLTADIEERPRPEGSTSGIDSDFALALCNYHFRLRRNAQQMAAEGKESKELRGINWALENIDELFEKYAIECRDLTGQRYDPGRVDFEPMSAPEAVPGLDHPMIGRCERPAVLVDGELIQKARGLVTKPA